VTTTRLDRASLRTLASLLGVLLRSAAWGVALGLIGLALIRLGVWDRFAGTVAAPVLRLVGIVHQAVGPVWIPMFLVALRVGWLAARAFRTRLAIGPFGFGVRPELQQLAPLFAALGLAGTVWGLTHAFTALQGGEFLDRLPTLLAGLGAAMTSTLVGLSLQITTLLIAAYNPAWSVATIQLDGDIESYKLDGARLGSGARGLAALLESLVARQPEALHLCMDPEIGIDRRGLLQRNVWQSLESSVPLRSFTSRTR